MFAMSSQPLKESLSIVIPVLRYVSNIIKSRTAMKVVIEEVLF